MELYLGILIVGTVVTAVLAATWYRSSRTLHRELQSAYQEWYEGRFK